MSKDNGKFKKVYIRPEDTLEFVYEMSDNWKNIEEMKQDLRKMTSSLPIEIGGILYVCM